MVSTASANTGVVYVKASSKPNIYVWGDNSVEFAGSWPGTLMTETNLYGITVYRHQFEYTGETYNVIFNMGLDQNQSSTLSGRTGTIYYKWDGNRNSEPSEYDYSISTVELKGILGDWSSENAMTLSNGIYSTSIDLTNSFDDQQFKIYVKNGANDDAWFGWNAFTLTDDGSLLSGNSGDGSNFVIANSNKSYKTYNVSVDFTDPTTPKMTFAGDATRGSKSYTVTLNNAAGWTNPYLHAFVGDVAQKGWPGFEMENDGGSTYSKTFTAYEPYPTKVIFSNNGDSQIPDLFLTDGHTYTNESEARYYVCGDGETFGEWDGGQTNALMTFVENGEEDYYTFSADNIVLNDNVNFKIIRKNYAEQVAPDGADWWPSSPQTITVSESGKYNVTVTFNSYDIPWSDSKIASGEATLVSIPVTITDGSGFATFSSATHDLDFTGITDVTAYRAASAVVGEVKMKKVEGKVPANEGLFLVGETTYIPVTTGASSIGENLLKPTTGSDIFDGSKFQYVLANQSGVAFYKVSSSLSPNAGKAYLQTDTDIQPSNNARVAIIFNDETAIQGVELVQQTDNRYYNLSGQRVAQLTKGLYIVNGKKIMINK